MTIAPQCRGVWLDRGELDKIIERSAAEVAPSQPASGAKGFQGRYKGKPSKKNLLKGLLDF